MNASPATQESSRHRAARGFTIVELMMTLIVAGILAALAAPSFTGIIMSSRLAAATNDLVSGIQIARSEAIKRNAAVQFCRTASDVATTCANNTGAWTHWIVRTQAGDDIIRRGMVNPHGGTLTVKSDFDGDTITFGSDGLGRTGANLVSDRTLTICSSSRPVDNVRELELGAGSRITTTKLSEAAPC